VQGDDDPVDVIEVGSKVLKTGGVYHIKALGAYAMMSSTTRSFFLRTSPWKPNFKRSATRRRDLRNPEPNLPGPAPRTLPKKNPRPALLLPKKRKVKKTYLLRPKAPRNKIQRAKLLRLRGSENFYSCGKSNASFWPQRGFVIRL
jgi:hypothetical protein